MIEYQWSPVWSINEKFIIWLHLRNGRWNLDFSANGNITFGSQKLLNWLINYLVALNLITKARLSAKLFMRKLVCCLMLFLFCSFVFLHINENQLPSLL